MCCTHFTDCHTVGNQLTPAANSLCHKFIIFLFFLFLVIHCVTARYILMRKKTNKRLTDRNLFQTDSSSARLSGDL